MQIDAHQHFWHPARSDYGWMPKDDPILSRPYAPADLKPLLHSAGISRTILVQAAPTVLETEYMLGMADATDWVAGVVGWVNFENSADTTQIVRLAGHPKFKGLRPMIQDIPDNAWMHRDDVQWAFRAIIDHDLTFDALGFPRHLDAFLTLLKRYPAMRVVIDHGMKPQIGQPGFAQWADGMARIAAETTAFCKLSGLVTEASPDWTTDILKPYTDHILHRFGPDRVMWGSDWPVCLLRGTYADWHNAARARVPQPMHPQVFGATAAAFYRVAP
jgi:L-fuconolactonase